VSLRDQILAAEDIQIEMVEVPEWGVTVEVRGMSGADRSALMQAVADSPEGKATISTMYVDSIIATAYDPETGERLFTPEDAGALNAKAASALDRLAEVSMRLSGMTAESTEDAKATFPEESAPEVPV